MEIFSVKSSGPSGDIINSLPAVKSFAKKTAPVTYYLHEGMKAFFYEGAEHPDGGVALTHKRIEMMIPLLEAQSYVKEARLWTGERIVLDMDSHMDARMGQPHGSLNRWWFHLWPELTSDLSEPCLIVQPAITDAIVVNRTSRYRNPKISYKFLQHRPEPILFLGTLNELSDFRKEVPRANLIHCDNFLETAQYIAGSKLFIGNQSMCFALAEQLKTPRILECAPPPFNNVIPTGKGAYDFFGQSQFQTLVEMLLT